MAIKRKSNDVAAPAESIRPSFKKPRGSETRVNLAHTEDELRDMPHEQLVAVAVKLNRSLAAAQQQLTEFQGAKPLQETSGNRQKPQPAWTPEQVSEKARQMRELSAKGIKRQMKWHPSCREGTTKWSFEGVAPNKDIFLRMFNFEAGSKPFKQKKVPISQFQSLFGDISASCRYNYLSITGENVNVYWNEDESTFKLSGTYGI